MEQTIEVRRTFWKERDFPFNDTAQPYYECEFMGGVRHGRCCFWHKNGQLAFKGYYKNGIPDGIGISWNIKGCEVCRHQIENGTGVERVLLLEKMVIIEIPWVNGVQHGVERHLTLEGKIKFECFIINGKSVNMEEYERACDQDTTLSRHETDRSKWVKTGDARWEELLERGEGVYDSRVWFADPNGVRRTLGEDTNNEQSRAIVESFYKSGAKAVLVFEVDEENQNSGRLLVELPHEKKDRQAVIRACNKWAKKIGFEPEKDRGQRYMLVMLD